MTDIKILKPGDGWQLRDQEGNVLLAVDATNRTVDVPSGTTLHAGGDEITSLAEQSTYTGDKEITGTLTVGTAIAIGASPAQSGAVRLETAAQIVARNHDGDGDLVLLTTDNIDTFIMRQDNGAGIRAFAAGNTVLTNGSNSYISVNTTDSIDVAAGSGSAGLFVAADGSISLTPDAGKAITAGPIILPTSDPHIVGAIWNNATVVTVSTG